MFIILAKLDFRVKFLHWFVFNKVDRSTDLGKEKVAEVAESINVAKEMINKITEFIAGASQKAKDSLIKCLNDEKKTKDNALKTETMLDKNEKVAKEKKKVQELQLELEDFS